MKNFKDELYKGLEVIVDYELTNDIDLIDWFEEQSLFEGFGRVKSFDDSYTWIEGCDYAVQHEYIILLDEED